MNVPAVRYERIDEPEIEVPFRIDGTIVQTKVWRGDHLDPDSPDGSVYLVVDFGVEERMSGGDYEPTGFGAMMLQRISAEPAFDPLAQPFIQRFQSTTETSGRSATGGVGIDSHPVVGLKLLPVSPRRP